MTTYPEPNERVNYGIGSPTEPSHLRNEVEERNFIETKTDNRLSKMDAYGVISIIFTWLCPIISVFTGWIAWKQGDSDFSRTLGKWSFIISIISIVLAVFYFIGLFLFIAMVGSASGSFQAG